MNQTQYLFVNGILTNPEDVRGWTDRAVEWINRNTPDKADKMEYRCGVLTRRLYQNCRVNGLQQICRSYMGDRIILVGHSNGCDIIERLVRKGLPKISEIHLIAAASEPDFEKNGFNQALARGKVDRICVYWSPVDLALKKARLSSRFLGFLGLGYGYLGLVGPKNVAFNVASQVRVIKRHLDHSQWFSRAHFKEIMDTIVANKI